MIEAITGKKVEIGLNEYKDFIKQSVEIEVLHKHFEAENYSVSKKVIAAIFGWELPKEEDD